MKINYKYIPKNTYYEELKEKSQIWISRFIIESQLRPNNKQALLATCLADMHIQKHCLKIIQYIDLK